VYEAGALAPEAEGQSGFASEQAFEGAHTGVRLACDEGWVARVGWRALDAGGGHARTGIGRHWEPHRLHVHFGHVIEHLVEQQIEQSPLARDRAIKGADGADASQQFAKQRMNAHDARRSGE